MNFNSLEQILFSWSLGPFNQLPTKHSQLHQGLLKLNIHQPIHFYLPTPAKEKLLDSFSCLNNRSSFCILFLNKQQHHSSKGPSLGKLVKSLPLPSPTSTLNTTQLVTGPFSFAFYWSSLLDCCKNSCSPVSSLLHPTPSFFHTAVGDSSFLICFHHPSIHFQEKKNPNC